MVKKIISILLLLYGSFSIIGCGSNSSHNDPVQSQFSNYDGSHPALNEYIKGTLNDPDSYEHVETRFKDRGDGIDVITTFRCKNGFGGIVTRKAKTKVNYSGQIIGLVEI